ncbi:MAG TPA: hypothetical protein VIM25_12655 [Candidatus Limnocylindrales bacterium]
MPRARRVGRVAAALLAGLLWLAFALTASAASPTPGPATGGDPRSSGQGPGLVGDPAFALLAVVAIGLGTVAGTLIYVRLTARTRR